MGLGSKTRCATNQEYSPQAGSWQISISWFGRSIAHHSGGKDSDQIGQGYLVGGTVVGHLLEVKDEVGQGVLVGWGELGYGLQGGCQTLFIVGYVVVQLMSPKSSCSGSFWWALILCNQCLELFHQQFRLLPFQLNTSFFIRSSGSTSTCTYMVLHN